jgi:hypothetical protein
LKKFNEYLIQHSLKSGGTKERFRWVKVPGTAPYWKAWHNTIFQIACLQKFCFYGNWLLIIICWLAITYVMFKRLHVIRISDVHVHVNMEKKLLVHTNIHVSYMYMCTIFSYLITISFQQKNSIWQYIRIRIRILLSNRGPTRGKVITVIHKQ